MKPFQIWMGWDPREVAAYDVARESIRSRTEHSLQIIPLKLDHLPMLTRPILRENGQMWDTVSNAPMSTEFAISRFLVPILQKNGWALFCDCDIICWSNIEELFALTENSKAVMVVKHDINYTEENGKPIRKMDEQIQTYYNRKNWSSVILWNCEHEANKRLTIDVINSMPGRDLHAFCWLNDYEIGDLPPKWNHLIDISPPGVDWLTRTGIWHYTLGGPWLAKWPGGSEDEAWKEEAVKLNEK